MTETTNQGLTIKQKRCIEALVRTSDWKRGAKAAGVKEADLMRWLDQDPAFLQALIEAKLAQLRASQESYAESFSAFVPRVLLTYVEAENMFPSIRLGAVRLLISIRAQLNALSGLELLEEQLAALATNEEGYHERYIAILKATGTV
jgi:hypothetical protein